MKKYKLTKNTKERYGTTLHQIKALRDFDDIKKGDLGGFIEKEENLSHYRDAWVCDDAMVSGDSRVSDDARVFGSAKVFDNAEVRGYARVYGDARVSGNARVSGDAQCSKTPIYTDEFEFQVLISDNHVQVGCQQFKKEEIDQIKYSDFEEELNEDEFDLIKMYVMMKLG